MKKAHTILIVALLYICTLSVHAEQVSIDGVQLDSPKPILLENRVLVPARVLLESIGFELKWDAEKQMVNATKLDFMINMKINDTNAMVNGIETKLDVPAKIIDDITYVPVRFIAEATGAIINYDPGTHLVTVTTANLKTPIVIQDPYFKAALEAELGVKNITVGDAYCTTELSLENEGIITLKGIDKFVNLKKLSLADNRISDISYVYPIVNLRELNVSNNVIKSIRGVQQLRNLERIDLTNNQITSFQPLGSMEALKHVSLKNNGTNYFSSLYHVQAQYDYLDLDRSLIEMPKYDTKYCVMGADFVMPINRGLNWVPVSSAGGSDMLNSSIPSFLKQSSRAKQGQIGSPHELVQMLAANKWFTYIDVLQRIPRADGIVWEVYPSGEDALNFNKGSDNNIAVIAEYLLNGDYLESGYLMVLYSDNQVKLLNYLSTDRNIKTTNSDDETVVVTERTFSVFKPSVHLMQSRQKPAYETGDIADYINSGGLDNNMVSCLDLKDYAKNLGSGDERIVGIVQYRPTARVDNKPFVFGYNNGRLIFSEGAAADKTLLYSKPGTTHIIEDGKFDLNKNYFPLEKVFDSYHN